MGVKGIIAANQLENKNIIDLFFKSDHTIDT